MRHLILTCLLFPFAAFGGVLEELFDNPELQGATIVNVRNPKFRELLKARFADAANWEKGVAVIDSLKVIAFCELESEGHKVQLVIGIGDITKKAENILKEQKIPASLIHEDGVILEISVDGKPLKGPTLEAFAKEMEAEDTPKPKKKR
jgi:hypothetical protein